MRPYSFFFSGSFIDMALEGGISSAALRQLCYRFEIFHRASPGADDKDSRFSLYESDGRFSWVYDQEFSYFIPDARFRVRFDYIASVEAWAVTLT